MEEVEEALAPGAIVMNAGLDSLIRKAGEWFGWESFANQFWDSERLSLEPPMNAGISCVGNQYTEHLYLGRTASVCKELHLWNGKMARPSYH